MTVFALLTHPVKTPAAGTEPCCVPIATVSPSAAPVTVIVKSLTVPADVLGKLSVAVELRIFNNGVPEEPITTPPAVTFSAVFVVPPDAVSVRATLTLLERFKRVLENVAAVEVVDEALLEPARDTFKAMGEVALVVPVT